MKIITIGEHDADFSPESALLLPGRPMFMPELAEGESVSLQPCVAVRVNRLGKSVSEKFAPRYIDAVAPALRMVFEPDLTPGLHSGMDSTVYVGGWRPALPTLMKAGDTAIDPSPVTPGRIAEALARVSRLTTMKMGDILLFPLPCPPLVPPPSKTHLTITTPAGEPLLDVKIV